MSDIETIRDFIADELAVRLDSFAVKTSDGRPDRSSVEPRHEDVVASAEAALLAAERLATCAQTAPMAGRKSLGLKLFEAIAASEGETPVWDDVAPEAKAMMEVAGFAFAASLSHDETASIVIATLREREAVLNKRAARVDGLRPEVLAFAHLMEAQLRANDHKPGWKKDGWGSLLHRLREEANQLHDGLVHAYFADYADRGARVFHDPKEIAAERTAHVANFAMMVADVCGALSPTREGGEPQ